MDEQLRLLEAKYDELEARSMQPDFYADPKAAAKDLFARPLTTEFYGL